MPDLLIELFSEEIPARMQTPRRRGPAKAGHQRSGRGGADLCLCGGVFHAAPSDADDRGAAGQLSPTTREERKGPKADAPEKAIEGFLRGAGLTRDQGRRPATPPKGRAVCRDRKTGPPGRPTSLPRCWNTTIRNFPWPKSMRWGTGALKWVRPLHSILCILNDEAGHEVVPMDVDGITCG